MESYTGVCERVLCWLHPHVSIADVACIDVDPSSFSQCAQFWKFGREKLKKGGCSIVKIQCNILKMWKFSQFSKVS